MYLTGKKTLALSACVFLSTFPSGQCSYFIFLLFVIMTIITTTANANRAFTMCQALRYLDFTTNRKTSLPALCRRDTEVQGVCQRRLLSQHLVRLEVKFSAGLGSASVPPVPLQWVYTEGDDSSELAPETSPRSHTSQFNLANHVWDSELAQPSYHWAFTGQGSKYICRNPSPAQNANGLAVAPTRSTRIEKRGQLILTEALGKASKGERVWAEASKMESMFSQWQCIFEKGSDWDYYYRKFRNMGKC